jgi:hypothetical protein
VRRHCLVSRGDVWGLSPSECKKQDDPPDAGVEMLTLKEKHREKEKDCGNT